MKMNDPESNKRKYPRAIFCIDVDVETSDNSFKGFTQNITPEGMFVETDKTMMAGQEVKVCFLMPESEDYINKQCRVVRVLPDGIGLEFNSPIECFLM